MGERFNARDLSSFWYVDSTSQIIKVSKLLLKAIFYGCIKINEKWDTNLVLFKVFIFYSVVYFLFWLCL